MIGYQFIILLLDKIMKYPKKMINTELLESQPSISILIVAHNEEKVILDKLKNVSKIEYPNEKTEIIVASDHSDDKTAEIIREFISNNPQKKIIHFNLLLYILCHFPICSIILCRTTKS